MPVNRPINIPSVVREVEEVFMRYESALLTNDFSVLDEMFLESPVTIRYGVADIQYGNAQLRAFRAAQVAFERCLFETHISTFGDDIAVASTLFRRADAPNEIGRQMQTWLKTSRGWRIAAAHVSVVQTNMKNSDIPDLGASPAPQTA